MPLIDCISTWPHFNTERKIYLCMGGMVQTLVMENLIWHYLTNRYPQSACHTGFNVFEPSSLPFWIWILAPAPLPPILLFLSYSSLSSLLLPLSISFLLSPPPLRFSLSYSLSLHSTSLSLSYSPLSQYPNMNMYHHRITNSLQP